MAAKGTQDQRDAIGAAANWLPKGMVCSWSQRIRPITNWSPLAAASRRNPEKSLRLTVAEDKASWPRVRIQCLAFHSVINNSSFVQLKEKFRPIETLVATGLTQVCAGVPAETCGKLLKWAACRWAG